MRHLEIPNLRSDAALRFSGNIGVPARGIVSLVMDPARIRLASYGFQVQFSIFADALRHRFINPNDQVGSLLYWPSAVEMPTIDQQCAYYYFVPPATTDVLLGTMPCECCYDTAYLDLMVAPLDLVDVGSILFIGVHERVLDETLSGPLLSWMARAGFRPYWFMGLKPKIGEGSGLLEKLYCLDDVAADHQRFLETFFPADHSDALLNALTFLVFQRETVVGKRAMLELLEEVTTWEIAHFDMRFRTYRPKFRSYDSSLGRLQRFKVQLPQFVAEAELPA